MLITRVCSCGTQYKVREADLKRGWGMSCTKKCAAIKRTKEICNNKHTLAKASKKYRNRNDNRGGFYSYKTGERFTEAEKMHIMIDKECFNEAFMSGEDISPWMG